MVPASRRRRRPMPSPVFRLKRAGAEMRMSLVTALAITVVGAVLPVGLAAGPASAAVAAGSATASCSIQQKQTAEGLAYVVTGHATATSSGAVVATETDLTCQVEDSGGVIIDIFRQYNAGPATAVAGAGTTQNFRYPLHTCYQVYA